MSVVDDDELIAKLRDRVFDPARRFDEVWLPRDWVRERFGRDRLFVDGVPRGYCSDGTVQFEAGCAEAVEFFEHAPRWPPFPPARQDEVEDSERLIGHRLPDLLRRVYTEVANGGFGPPHSGLASITEGRREPGDQKSAVAMYLRDRREGLPPWLHLSDAGCAIHWYVALDEPDAPVHLFSFDNWYDADRRSPEAGILYSIGLREWLRSWAEGRDLWEPVLARARSHGRDLG